MKFDIGEKITKTGVTGNKDSTLMEDSRIVKNDMENIVNDFEKWKIQKDEELRERRKECKLNIA